MRLLVVMPSARAIGGAEEMLLQFVLFATNAKLDVSVAFLEYGPLAEIVARSARGVTTIDAGRTRQPVKYCKAIVGLHQLIRKTRPAVVLSWMTKAQLYAGPAARLAGVPTICFQHGLPDDSLIDRASRHVPCDGFIACSNYVAGLQALHTTRPVVSVCSAVNLARVLSANETGQAELRVRLNLPAGRRIITIVGRLQRWKGMHVFIEALALVRSAHPDVFGVIVGGTHDLEPDYPEILRKLIQDLGLEGTVQLAGPQTNIPEWMLASDVIVNASEREPFGIVIIEGMALGKPVIATRPGGPEEIITDGIDGLLIPHSDARGLCIAIQRVLEDKPFAARCALAAEIRARKFDGADYPARVKGAVEQLIAR